MCSRRSEDLHKLQPHESCSICQFYIRYWWHIGHYITFRIIVKFFIWLLNLNHIKFEWFPFKIEEQLGEEPINVCYHLFLRSTILIHNSNKIVWVRCTLTQWAMACSRTSNFWSQIVMHEGRFLKTVFIHMLLFTTLHVT